jgi:hypothetical protein
MDATEAPAPEPGITWAAGWGDKVAEGDLIRVPKLKAPMRIINLRRFSHNHKEGPRPALVDDNDDGHWYYGAICEDRVTGEQYHVFIAPHEPVFVAVEVPTDLSQLDEDDTPSQES